MSCGILVWIMSCGILVGIISCGIPFSCLSCGILVGIMSCGILVCCLCCGILVGSRIRLFVSSALIAVCRLAPSRDPSVIIAFSRRLFASDPAFNLLPPSDLGLCRVLLKESPTLAWTGVDGEPILGRGL